MLRMWYISISHPVKFHCWGIEENWLSRAHCTICVYTLMEESLKLVVDWEVVNSRDQTGWESANMQGAKKVSFTACHLGKL